MVKKTTANIKENELYIIPSSNDEMREFVTKFKVDMMEHVVKSIKYALENKLPLVEVFQFKNSSFVVTIAKKEFKSNVEHIYNFYKKNEIYELYPKVEQLYKLLNEKYDEKEKPNNSRNDSPEL